MFNHQHCISKCLLGKTVKDVIDDPLAHAKLMHASGVSRKDACSFFQSVKDFHDYPFLVYYNSQYIKPVYRVEQPKKSNQAYMYDIGDPTIEKYIKELVESQIRAERKIRNLYRMIYKLKATTKC